MSVLENLYINQAGIMTFNLDYNRDVWNNFLSGHVMMQYVKVALNKPILLSFHLAQFFV